MSNLSPNEAAVLTHVTCFPNLSVKRRLQLLSRASLRAKAIGRIIIEGEKGNEDPEYIRIAEKFLEWGAENER